MTEGGEGCGPVSLLQAEQMRGDQKSGGHVAAELLKKHEWIQTEKPLFGQPGGDYDFGARNFREAEEELKAKQSEQHGYA